jgi:hypothetical protein
MFGGMFFADSIASGIIAATHTLNLEASQTYSTAYRELLVLLDRRYAKNRDRNSNAVKAELSGTYTLPEPEPEPEPTVEAAKPEPEITTPVPEPIIQIPNVNWSQINKDLDEQARRYLEGIR